VEDAAQFAIKQIQSRSNSLIKPELKKVKEAKAQVRGPPSVLSVVMAR
jgi:hypothetical protein